LIRGGKIGKTKKNRWPWFGGSLRKAKKKGERNISAGKKTYVKRGEKKAQILEEVGKSSGNARRRGRVSNLSKKKREERV